MPAVSTDRIDKEQFLDWPRSRVWRALTDVREFSEWFGVALNSPFVAGTMTSGNITNPGYGQLVAQLWIETLEPQTRFAFRWHPDAKDPGVDYSKEPTTLVTFILADEGMGTKLTIVESGFDAIPESRRSTAFAGNERGWGMQLVRIMKYLASHARPIAD